MSKGNKAHRYLVEQMSKELERKGYKTIKEYVFPCRFCRRRYIDVLGVKKGKKSIAVECGNMNGESPDFRMVDLVENYNCKFVWQPFITTKPNNFSKEINGERLIEIRKIIEMRGKE